MMNTVVEMYSSSVEEVVMMMIPFHCLYKSLPLKLIMIMVDQGLLVVVVLITKLIRNRYLEEV